jgi:hypothetical protein
MTRFEQVSALPEPFDDPVEDEPHRPFPDPEHSIAPRKPRTVGGAAFLLVLLGTAVGLALIVFGPWRQGLAVIGGVLIAGAFARLVIPNHDAGMLGVRRKLFDVATLTALGAALVVLAVVIPPPPPA